jgi:hypothetical protein
MREFMDAGWIVLLTSKRNPRLPSGADSPLSLSDARGQLGCYNIRIHWAENGGLSWEPSEARVNVDDLDAYGTAA